MKVVRSLWFRLAAALVFMAVVVYLLFTHGPSWHQLADEQRRQALGAAARRLVQERYGWDGIAQRLLRIYELVTGVRAEPETVTR